MTSKENTKLLLIWINLAANASQYKSSNQPNYEAQCRHLGSPCPTFFASVEVDFKETNMSVSRPGITAPVHIQFRATRLFSIQRITPWYSLSSFLSAFPEFHLATANSRVALCTYKFFPVRGEGGHHDGILTYFFPKHWRSLKSRGDAWPSPRGNIDTCISHIYSYQWKLSFQDSSH